METLKTQLSEYIATGYEFDAMMDLGDDGSHMKAVSRTLL